MVNDEYFPLFETKQAKGRLINRVLASSVFVAICVVWIYRVTYLPRKVEDGRLGWILLFLAEIWFTFYWILTQAVRWNSIFRFPYKDRLSKRYEQELPKVDIFVCTADPMIEPPLMVVNTVLSVMAYDYPSDKLSIYLSDDGGSILTFYALFEASQFSKNWLPYCKLYSVKPRSPCAYFKSMPKPTTTDAAHSRHFESIKKLYEEMSNRIETATNLCEIPEQVLDQHKGFTIWNDSYNSKHDHATILQLLIDGRNEEAIDVEGHKLPKLVYLAREKRPQYPHNFKAGAMNALLRVSSEISYGWIILNVDCDMYSNNSQSIRDALCFFMDEKKSHDIGFVQFPQKFQNATKNDLYGSTLHFPTELEFYGLDGFGGPLYIGTGCFLQREILCGREYSKNYKIDWKAQNALIVEGTIDELEARAKTLASCTYELNSQWGKEMGLKYGCPVEDVITGLAIQCRGWKSVYLNPKRSGFLGLAATTLEDSLVQHKRWSEGQLQVFLSYCPLWYGYKRIKLGLQLCYCHYDLWAINSLATLCYCTIPSLYMLRDISLFPQLSSIWCVPFSYIAIVNCAKSLVEFLSTGGTTIGWWNEQRMWLYKRVSSYLFALFDTILKLLGFSKMGFVITNKKLIDEDILQRYEKEIMEFGVPSLMFTMITSLGLLNLFSLIVFVKILLVGKYQWRMIIDRLSFQILLCGVLVLINLPLFRALFLRKDKGKMPSSVTVQATVMSIIVVLCFCL